MRTWVFGAQYEERLRELHQAEGKSRAEEAARLQDQLAAAEAKTRAALKELAAREEELFMIKCDLNSALDKVSI